MFEIVLNDILWIDVRRCENNFCEAVMKKAESRDECRPPLKLETRYIFFITYITKKDIRTPCGNSFYLLAKTSPMETESNQGGNIDILTTTIKYRSIIMKGCIHRDYPDLHTIPLWQYHRWSHFTFRVICPL